MRSSRRISEWDIELGQPINQESALSADSLNTTLLTLKRLNAGLSLLQDANSRYSETEKRRIRAKATLKCAGINLSMIGLLALTFYLRYEFSNLLSIGDQELNRINDKWNTPLLGEKNESTSCSGSCPLYPKISSNYDGSKIYDARINNDLYYNYDCTPNFFMECTSALIKQICSEIQEAYCDVNDSYPSRNTYALFILLIILEFSIGVCALIRYCSESNSVIPISYKLRDIMNRSEINSVEFAVFKQLNLEHIDDAEKLLKDFIGNSTKLSIYQANQRAQTFLSGAHPKNKESGLYHFFQADGNGNLRRKIIEHVHDKELSSQQRIKFGLGFSSV